ncbi:FecR domain-containing protein [Methylovorus mays]|uniref:FecR domain-containing protein n=1 Tax=Methylovorus mays TaxID=184077 RepID=UPI001E3B2DB4|nr:FecR domain-containing protein [Methylovorus mays]MCB5206986.1 FecR domain-containing protein [Methylovorus mays]
MSDTCSEIDASIVRQAIDWLVKVQSKTTDMSVQQGCQLWRNEHPDHERAWQRVCQMGGDLSASALHEHDRDIANKVLQLAMHRIQRRRTLKLLGLTFIAGSSALLAHQVLPWQNWSADYRTATGQRRILRLADGTVLILNTDTAVDIRFSPQERLIVLVHGEILVTSGHGELSDAPLRVSTRQAMLQALGTRFVVRQEPDVVQVSVEESAVAIRTSDGAQTSVIAYAGDHYRISHGDGIVRAALAMEPAAWADGLLSVNNMRLTDFINELSRYRSGYLRCAAEVAELRLSGVFQLDDIDNLLKLLQRKLPVRIAYVTRWWVTVLPA